MYRVAAACGVLFLLSSSTWAQEPERGWIDVNLVAGRSMQGSQTLTLEAPLFGKTSRASVEYPDLGTGIGLIFGGGVSGFGPVGIAINATVAQYEIQPSLAVRVPHPLVFNDFASDSVTTDGVLDRSDIALDFSASYVLPSVLDPWRVRVFAGPTFFHTSQDMIEIIEYDQGFNQFGANLVEITGYTQREVTASAWGLHGGVDVSYFFSDNVGIGAVFRVNRGTIDVDNEPLTGDAADLVVGHTTLGAGVRFRF